MKTKTTRMPAPTIADLPRSDLDAAELAAHRCVPEDATEEEAQEIYAKELARLVKLRQQGRARWLREVADLALEDAAEPLEE